MRCLLAIVICTAFVAPSVASAQVLSAEQAEEFRSVAAHPAECARLRRQVEHFLMMQQRAATLDNEMWNERLTDHVNTLRALQAARCPQDLPVDSTAEAFQQLLALAAKGALTYFTFGAAGF